MNNVRTKLLPQHHANSLVRDHEEQANAAAKRFAAAIRSDPHIEVDGVPIICHHGVYRTTMVVVIARHHGGIAVHLDSCCPACEHRLERFPVERGVELTGMDPEPKDGTWDYSRFLDGPQRVKAFVLLGVQLRTDAHLEIEHDPSQLWLWPQEAVLRQPMLLGAQG